MRLRTNCATRGGAVSGLPALNGGAGAYSRPSSIASADLSACDFRDQRQREIDACGHAAAGHEIAVADDPRLNGNRAESCEQIVRRPMGGRAFSLEQSRSAEHERSGAHRSDEPRPLRLPLHEVDRRLVGHQRVDPCPAGHAKDVELRTIVERRVGLEDEPGR